MHTINSNHAAIAGGATISSATIAATVIGTTVVVTSACAVAILFPTTPVIASSTVISAAVVVLAGAICLGTVALITILVAKKMGLFKKQVPVHNSSAPVVTPSRLAPAPAPLRAKNDETRKVADLVQRLNQIQSFTPRDTSSGGTSSGMAPRVLLQEDDVNKALLEAITLLNNNHLGKHRRGGERKYTIQVKIDQAFLHLKKKIGKGMEKSAKLALRVDRRGNIYPIAKLSFSTNDPLSYRSFLNEVSLLKMLNHQNVPKLYFSDITAKRGMTRYRLYEDLAMEGCIADKRFTKQQMQILVIEALTLLSELEEKKIIHGDIKPINLLLDLKGHLQLIDFGHGYQIGNPNHTIVYPHGGTSGFAAPEVMTRSTITTKKDVYSMGKTLGKTFIELANYRLIPGSFSELIRRMIEENQEKRITAKEALQRAKEIPLAHFPGND
jgi:hypothetical protein